MVTSNVSIRFSVKDQEVVRAALDKLGKDGETALRRLDEASKRPAAGMRALESITGSLRNSVVGLALNVGPAGSALVALGPAGLAAAAGIGAVIGIIQKVSSAANEFANDMVRLRDTAQTMGLTTTQLQAISDVGSEFALSEEKVASGLQKFSEKLDEARRAQGALFETMQRINPALADELIGTTNLAAALDVMGKAYAQADASRQSALSKAAFGKGGFDIALLVQSVARQGGVDELTQAFTRSGDAIDKGLLERVAKLQTAINDMSKDASRNLASIFSEQLLQNEFLFVERFRQFSRDAKEFSISPTLDKLLDVLTKLPTIGPGAALNPLADIIAAGAALIKRLLPGTDDASLEVQAKTLRDAIARVTPAEGDNSLGARNARSGIAVMQKQLTQIEQRLAALRSQGFDEAGFAGLDITTLEAKSGAGKAGATAAANIQRDRIALLGDAATETEKLTLKTLELAAAVADHGAKQVDANRSLAAFKLDQQQADATMRLSLGIIDETQLSEQRLATARAQFARFNITDQQQIATAEQLIRKEILETIKAMEVRKSSTPALTKLRQDANDLNAELDSGLAGGLRGITQEFSLLNNSSATFGERLRNISLRLADVILQAILMKTVVKPLADLFEGGLKSLFGGGGSALGKLTAPVIPVTQLPLPALGGGGDMMSTWAAAMRKIETGSFAGNYSSVNPTSGALGAYQVLPSSLRDWAPRHLGRDVSPDEFLNNPGLQDQLFKARFGMYADKYGAEGASRAWYRGEGGMNNTDVIGANSMTPQQYGGMFTRNVQQQTQAFDKLNLSTERATSQFERTAPAVSGLDTSAVNAGTSVSSFDVGIGNATNSVKGFGDTLNGLFKGGGLPSFTGAPSVGGEAPFGGDLAPQGMGRNSAVPYLRNPVPAALSQQSAAAAPAMFNQTIINETGAQVQTDQRRNSRGGLDIRTTIRQAVRDDLASGEHDSVLGTRFGARRMARVA